MNILTLILISWLGYLNPTETLSLATNSLVGTIPSEIALLTNLGECGSIWLCLLLPAFSYSLLCGLVLFFHFSYTDRLQLYGNSFMGEYACPYFIEHCEISCFDKNNTNAACRSLWEELLVVVSREFM